MVVSIAFVENMFTCVGLSTVYKQKPQKFLYIVSFFLELSTREKCFIQLHKTLWRDSSLTKIERIIAPRYGPLVLPVPLNLMPAGEYQKYMPKFTGTEGVIAEEHLESFYSYADNLDISENDVWVRTFVQILDGEARKWFREFPLDLLLILKP